MWLLANEQGFSRFFVESKRIFSGDIGVPDQYSRIEKCARTLTFSSDNYTMEPKAIQSQINSCPYDGGT
jgi:hypothetical protein